MFMAAEALILSGIVYVTVNDQLFGGLTPISADIPGQGLGGFDFPGDIATRAPRLVGLWLDRSYGALRWAPFAALAFVGLWLLWRSRRDRLATVLPERRETEIAATLCALVCAAQVAVAVFVEPTMFGFWFPGRYLLPALPVAVGLCAWGLQRAPRTGTVLAAVTIGTSAWLYAELRIDGGALVGPSSRAPLGPLDAVLPRFGTDAAGTVAALVLAGAAVAAFVAWELRAARRGRRLAALYDDRQ
jgi:hypothetical protein